MVKWIIFILYCYTDIVLIESKSLNKFARETAFDKLKKKKIDSLLLSRVLTIPLNSYLPLFPTYMGPNLSG